MAIFTWFLAYLEDLEDQQNIVPDKSSYRLLCEQPRNCFDPNYSILIEKFRLH